MRLIDDDDVSDSDSEEPSNDVLSWCNDNTVLQTKRVVVKNSNTANVHKHFSSDLYNQRDKRRKRSPLSMRSIQSFQKSVGLPNSNSFPNKTLIDRTRGASPMSLRSVSNFGSTISTQDAKNITMSYLKNCKKNDFKDCMRVVERRRYKKRSKIKKMRCLTKGPHLRYGSDSGDHCSNSSDSSKDSKSSRSSLTPYKNTNFSTKTQSDRPNRSNHNNRSLRSKLTASTINTLQSKDNHIIDNVVNSFRITNYDARLSTNKLSTSKILHRMPIDDDVRSVKTLPSTFNSNNRFKNMFSLEPKVCDSTQNRTHANYFLESQNKYAFRQNVSKWPLKGFDKSTYILPSEQKCEGNENSDEELVYSNESSFNKYNIHKHANVNNKRMHNNNNINFVDSKISFRPSNTHNDDNRSVRSEPSVFKNNKTLSKSKVLSKNSFDIVPRSFINTTSHKKLINNFPSTSQNRNLSNYNSSRLVKTFNSLIQIPPIEEKDENDNVSDECSSTTNVTDIIENRDNFRGTNSINAKEKQIDVFGKYEGVFIEQNENSGKSSNKKDNDNISVQSVPSTFSYNSSLCSKPIANIKNVFAVKMRASNNISFENRRLNDLTSKFNNESSLNISLRATNDSICKPCIAEQQDNDSRKEKILASSRIAIRKQNNKYTNVGNDSDQDEDIFYKSNVSAKEQNNIPSDRQKQNTQQNITSELHEPLKPKMKMVTDFIFAKPKTPKPQIKSKSKNDAIFNKNQPHVVPRSSDSSDNIYELTHQSVSDISLRPSFIRRKLFTQTLEITENSQNDSSESLPQSPLCNIYRTKHSDHKVHRSILPKSLLEVDIDDDTLGRNKSNMSQLVHKIIPQNRVSALTQNVQISHKLQDDEKSEDDRCDVISIMLMHNKDEISDTYSDSDNVNDSLNNDLEHNKEPKINSNCKVQLIKLTPQQSNYLKKESEKPGIGAKHFDKPQVNLRSNIVNSRTVKNLGENVSKDNAISHKLKSVKNNNNDVNKTSDKIKKTMKIRRKRSLSEMNDSGYLESQRKRPKTSCNTCVEDNRIAPNEKKRTNDQYFTKKSTKTPGQKSRKEFNMQKYKIIDGNEKLKKCNNIVNRKKSHEIHKEVRVTRNSANKSLQDSLTLIRSKSLHNSVQKVNNLDTLNKQAKSSKNQITKTISTMKPTPVSEVKSRKEVCSQKVKSSESNKKCQKRNCDLKKYIESPRELRVTRASANTSSQDLLNLTASKNIHRRRTPRVLNQHELKIMSAIKSSEDVTTSRRTRRSHLQAGRTSLREHKKEQNEKKLCHSKKLKTDILNDQNTVLKENMPRDLYMIPNNVHGLGIVKSRFDIVPKHCSKGRLGCGDDNKSIISTSTIMTRSRNKIFTNAF